MSIFRAFVDQRNNHSPLIWVSRYNTSQELCSRFIYRRFHPVKVCYNTSESILKNIGYRITQKITLQWRHNERDGVWNHQPHDCLHNRLFRRRKLQSSESLAFVPGIHRWPVNSPYKGPVTRKMFSFDDVIMRYCINHLFNVCCIVCPR